ncbi:DUF2617 family protein [Rhodococcus sp. SGAir0479]|uniref:DUF2617 family protein n=1 Tax=Rhodococcus sp. SGAir0479 TaxID=2567884 RepID=UPI0010CD5AE2|nr:DUF2617 family protein [Rhodococcus sp. SGAir0479]QCQ91587.1 DUF2617 family protein [Rhodococcus sp. SGAir0479]
MSVHLLDVEPTDVAADALGLVLDAPVPEMLASLRLHDAAAGTVTLGVLGASHVVVGETDRVVLTEQVSCTAVLAGGHRLPDTAERPGYRFAARTERVSGAELRRRAADLRARSTDDRWVCGAFPGDRDALTALTAVAEAGQWRWRTWHLYPGDGHGTVVATESRWRP